MFDDALTIGITAGLGAINFIRAGAQANKILKNYPDIANTLKKLKAADETVKVAKSSKITGKLINGIVELAYPGIGSTLVKEYGDDAAKLIFKYGENAISAITKGGENVLKLAKQKGGKQALQALLQSGDDALELLAKNAEHIDDVAKFLSKAGKQGVELAKKYGDDFLEIYAKYGDETLNLISQLGKNNGRIATKIIKEYGDDVLKELTKIAKNDPKNLNKAIRYIEARGIDGINDLKNKSVNLSKITSRSIKTSGSLLKKLKPIVDKYLKKGAIKLTKGELEDAKNNKSSLRALMKNFDCENIDEFLIRLKEGDATQVEKLLGVVKKDGKYITNGKTKAKEFLENYIRSADGGQNHEFLLTSNYVDYLLNSEKWGEDGASIALAVRKLIQKTKDVKINGYSHFQLYGSSKAMKEAKAADPIAWKAARDKFEETIHSLSNVMENSSDIGSLFENVKSYVSKTLDPESAEKFLEIWENCVR